MTSSAEEKLRERYLSKLPEKILNLNSFLLERDKSSAQSILHKLAGSAGMYGFPRISVIAAEMEDLIVVGERLGSERMKKLSSQLNDEVDQIQMNKR